MTKYLVAKNSSGNFLQKHEIYKILVRILKKEEILTRIAVIFGLHTRKGKR